MRPKESEQELADVPRLRLQPEPGVACRQLRLVGRRRGDLIFIEMADVWAFEAADRLTFVHSASGRFDLDVSLKELEALLGANLLRPHRNWLVYRSQVREWRRSSERSILLVGARTGAGTPAIEVPVAPDRLPAVRDALLEGAVGLRRRAPRSVSTPCAGPELVQ